MNGKIGRLTSLFCVTLVTIHMMFLNGGTGRYVEDADFNRTENPRLFNALKQFRPVGHNAVLFAFVDYYIICLLYRCGTLCILIYSGSAFLMLLALMFELQFYKLLFWTVIFFASAVWGINLNDLERRRSRTELLIRLLIFNVNVTMLAGVVLHYTIQTYKYDPYKLL